MIRAMVSGLAIGLAALTVAAPAIAAPSTAPVRITWIGGPTMLIRFGPIQILTDPVLGEGKEAFRIYDPNTGAPDVPQARLTRLPQVPIADLDLVLLSHAHEDHLDRSAVARLGGRASFLLPPSQVDGVRKRGVARAEAIGWTQSRTLSEGGYQVRITAVAARHTTKAELLPILGEVNGYLLEFRRKGYRRTMFWTGDSFAPAGEIPTSLKRPDLFVPHLGGVGGSGPTGYVSMGQKHAIAFARALKPRAVLPIHHSTFSLYREPIEPFFAAARTESFRVVRPVEGQEFELK